MNDSAFLHQIASFSVIFLSALGLIALERRFPYTTNQKFLRKGFFTDLVGYGIFQGYLLGITITAMVAWVDRTTQLSSLGLVSDWAIPLQLLFFVVTHDFYIYWFHRLQHRSRSLWRIHEAHHSLDDVDWLSGSRSHALEIFINQTIEFMPMVLLGAAPVVILMKVTLDVVWGMFIHSNLNV